MAHGTVCRLGRASCDYNSDSLSQRSRIDSYRCYESASPQYLCDNDWTFNNSQALKFGTARGSIHVPNSSFHLFDFLDLFQ